MNILEKQIINLKRNYTDKCDVMEIQNEIIMITINILKIKNILKKFWNYSEYS